jgi:adenylate cyclase
MLTKTSHIIRSLFTLTPLRIGLSVAVLVSTCHFLIEGMYFSEGLLSSSGFIRSLDLKWLDSKFRTRDFEAPPPRVVVAAIDEESVERYGLWPFSRQVFADFIDRTHALEAKVIGFDVLFGDVDRTAHSGQGALFWDAYKRHNLDRPPPVSIGSKGALGVLESSHQKSIATTKQLARGLKDLNIKGSASSELLDAFKQLEKEQLQNHGLLERSLRQQVDEHSRWAKFREDLTAASKANSPDAALEGALSRSPEVVLGYINFYNNRDIVGLSGELLSESMTHLDKSSVAHAFELRAREIGGQSIREVAPLTDLKLSDLSAINKVLAARAPLARFGKVSQHFGYFNGVPDPDGQMRRLRIVNRYQGRFYSALSLVMAARFLEHDIRPIASEIYSTGIQSIELGDTKILTTVSGALLLNYYRDPEEYFPTFPISDFIDGRVPAKFIKGKAVLVGMVAHGLHDLKPTPFNPTTPGVYVHATALQNILDNRFLKRQQTDVLLEILAMLTLGALLGLLLPRLPPLWGLIATMSIIVTISVIDTNVFFPAGHWVVTVLPMGQVLVTYIGINLYGYLVEGREKRKIRNTFQHFLAPSVVDEMLSDPENLKLGGISRECTIFFSDIRGFTTLSEQLTPTAVSNLLNEYLTPMTNLVFEHGGTLDKYMGDAIMAIFGAPVSRKDHAVRACHCALDMLSVLSRLQEDWKRRGLPIIDIGIGLNTGEMMVGNMGSDMLFDYTAIGDHVNLGSRLEGINKQYGTHIIISESTREMVGDAIHSRKVGLVQVKGRTEPVSIFELLGKGKASEDVQELIDVHEEGLALFQQQEWNASIVLINKILAEIKPHDPTAKLLLGQCLAFQKDPPPADWRGLHRMTTK